MSLIRIRRERKEAYLGGPAKPPRLWKLVAALILVVLLIYWLGNPN